MSNLCNCLHCEIAKDFSHENMSKRLYTLITKSYKSISYRDSEIKRYLQWIVDKNLFTEIENIYLTDEHKQQQFFAYCLAPEFNTVILWHKAEIFNYMFFIKANSELLAYRRYANLYTHKKDIFRCKYLPIQVLSGRVCI